jgi:hypothetical protein
MLVPGFVEEVVAVILPVLDPGMHEAERLRLIGVYSLMILALKLDVQPEALVTVTK